MTGIEKITIEGEDGSVNYTETKSNSWYMFTPDVETNKVIVSVPGLAGGGVAAAGNYADYVKENPAYVAVFNSPGNNDWNSGLSDAITTLNPPEGATLDLYTFSAATVNSIDGALLEANRKTDSGQNFYEQINVHIIDTGEYGTNHYNYITDETIENLVDSNINIVFEPHEGSGSDSRLSATQITQQYSVQRMVNGGVNVFIATQPVEGHTPTWTYVLENWLPIMEGTANEEVLSDIDILVPQKNSDGSILKDENGNIIWGNPTEEDLEILLPDIYAKAFSERYDTLDKLSKYRGLDETCVASDLYEVYSNMLSINQEIISTNAIYENIVEEASSSIVANMNISTNALFGITKSVMTNLSNDTEAICSLAEYIYQMDQELCANTTEINDGLTSLIDTLKISESYNSYDLKISTLNIELNGVDTSSISTNMQVGTVGRINVNEIISALTPLLISLENESNDATKMSNTLKSVSSSFGSGNLLGEVWTKTAEVLDEYVDLMNIRKEASNTLSEALKVASSMIIEYMNPDIELDDSKLPELRINLQVIKDNLDGVKRTKTYFEAYITKEDEETGELYKEQRGSNDQIAYYKNVINDYETQYKELVKQIDKIEGLAEVMNKANQVIESAIETIKTNYGTASKEVGGIRKVKFDSKN